MKVKLTTLSHGGFITCDIKRAAKLAQLDIDEIEWALDDEGICETDEYRIEPAD